MEYSHYLRSLEVSRTCQHQRAKEVKQFLGLAGYFCKFVPQLSDLSRPLTRLTWKDILFKWTKECQLCFELFKETLCTHPILWYPDPNRPYVLFLDISKYGWAGVLTQAYEKINELTQSTAKGGASQKKTVIHHPVSYISGHFRGSQLNWAALTKEALFYIHVYQKAQLLAHQC